MLSFSLWKFIRNWTLPLAMLTGGFGYIILSSLIFLNPIKPLLNEWMGYLTPILIFSQLLLTFCKVNPIELLPRPWHVWFLFIQLFCSLLLAGVLVCCPKDSSFNVLLEAAMVCFICPTATAAAVITGKLGGSVAMLTTYTLFSNLLTAVVVPLLFPMVEPQSNVNFVIAFLNILSKVFPLLLSPFLIALFLRYCCKPVHQFLVKCSGLAFYLWAIALTIVTGQTVRSLMHSTASPLIECLIALVGLFTCCIQFFLGKKIGGAYQDRISGGQALGQKNTVLAIWMAYTYLNPLASVGPGSYVLWQNIINSYQLWKKRKREETNQI